MTIGTRVNPFAIEAGDSIATKYHTTTDPKTGDDIIIVSKSREVRRVAECTVPEKIHLDGECYDGRFATVIKPNK